MGSSLKSVTWLPLPWPSRRPPLQHVASLIPPGGRGKLCPADVPPSPDISQPASATEWKRSAIRLPRSDMSGSAGNAYPEYLTRQTLAICRIHFCPQSRSKPRQHRRPSLLNYHPSSIQDTLDKTFPNLLRLPNTFPIPKIIN